MPIGKNCELPCEPLQVGVQFIAPDADGSTQARIVPPGGVEARPCLDNALALRRIRRQGPGSGDHVRLSQILQQEVPSVCCLVPRGFKAARHDACRCRSGNIGVERYLLPSRIPRRSCSVGVRSLENERTRDSCTSREKSCDGCGASGEIHEQFVVHTKLCASPAHATASRPDDTSFLRPASRPPQEAHSRF